MPSHNLCAATPIMLAALTIAVHADAHVRPHHHPRHHAHRPKPEVGRASYFTPRLAGKTTASGHKAKPAALTAASLHLPLGTTARVTNKETGKSVVVKVTDRGPYAHHRIMDVSPKAAEQLGMTHDGVAKVKVTPLHVPKPKP